jgi:hypothetical protein
VLSPPGEIVCGLIAQPHAELRSTPLERGQNRRPVFDGRSLSLIAWRVASTRGQVQLSQEEGVPGLRLALRPCFQALANSNVGLFAAGTSETELYSRLR